MTLLGLQAREKGIELHVDYGDGVPLSVRSDPVRLKQILVNIVGNAIKFTSKGEVRVVITPTAPQKLAFVVVDTGVGISSALARTLFNPFAQGDASRTRTAGGTGLGLVLARRLANLLGGDVTLTSTEVGRGSTFTITIDPGPVVAAGRKLASVRQRDQDALFAPERGDAPGAPQPGYVALEALPRVMAAEGGSTPRLDGLRILLVDDSPDNQLLIRRILSLSGAHVEVANNGREGVEQIVKAQNGTPYDVVVMDIQMPVMDGYEAIAQIRSHGLKLPVLALTAHALREEHDRCLASGFNSHLCKPINRAALLGTVFAHACKTSAAPHRETPLQEVTRTATAIT
jgi:CheY-like chemotaxis protein/anti-sigma regulatory factor (Ser/Thr protein kinase)